MAVGSCQHLISCTPKELPGQVAEFVGTGMIWKPRGAGLFAQSHFRSSLGMLIRALEDGFGIGLSGEQDVVEERKHENPERTLANKVEDVRIFPKEFGVTKLLKKNEEPKYHKKIVIAH